MQPYQLLDSGDGRKLERVGEYTIIRPAPQALWAPFTPDVWSEAQSEFVKEKGEKGVWRPRNLPEDVKKKDAGKGVPDAWNVASPSGIRYYIEPNEYGNIGIFPEHWIYSAELPDILPKNAQVLNVFTYTGSSALDLVKAGARVTAVDSAKTAMNTYVNNLEANKFGRQGSRLVLEDATKFLQREIRRESQYDCVMIDAPSYGRGTKNEVFDLEKELVKLLRAAKSLCRADGTIIITLHSPRYTQAALEQTVRQLFAHRQDILVQELKLEAENGSYLTSGTLIQIH